MERKSLRDISWLVTEEEYRADTSLSYSTLARYEREGFNNLDKLFDRIETPSLTFGSAVDSIITGGQEEFNDRFMVAEFPSTPDSIIKMVKSLFSQYGEEYRSLITIPDSAIISETECQGYQMNWKPETRAKVVKEKGADYYNLLFVAGSRTILDSQTYQDVCNAVNALKNSASTKFYFAEDNPFEPDIERLYQLKFKGTFNSVEYRCMVDELIVDHERKLIIPVDLKTSSKYEWDFYKSFLDWHYFTQARLYWRIIRANLDKDPYFKDFTLSDYKFIVINRRTLTPLVWNFTSTQIIGELHLGKESQIVIRDPFAIGEELSKYLLERPIVPNGINLLKPNNLEEWINKV